MLAMVVAACGGSRSNNSPALTRRGTITIWPNWQGGYLDAKKAIFDAYTKQYPNVTINLVHKDDIATAVTTAVPAGQGPDIVAWVDDVGGKFVNLEVIKPIDGLDRVARSYMTAH